MSAWVWELRGAVRVAVPAPQVNTEVVARTVHDLIACATCRARVDESCKTSSGKRRRPHDLRFAPQLCPCGNSRGGPKRKLCPSCAEISTREAKRDYMRRRRAS
jgi:hypothetical protein